MRDHVPAGERAVPSRLVFVGPIVTDAPNGSTVKNGLLVSGLRAKGVDVQVIDTGDASGASRISQLGALFRGVLANRQALVSVSQNGFYVLSFLLGLFSLLVPRLKYAIVGMGSGMPRDIERTRGLVRAYLQWSLRRATAIYVQGEWIKRDLTALGVDNASVLANLRPRPARLWNPASLRSGRLVFVSRVIPDKGIERAMEAVERLRSEGRDVALDVYGPVPEGYLQRFNAILTEHPGSMYRGVLAPEQVVEVLAQQGILLLPTTWASEGMPGILVEAAMVGMPVIASDLEPISEVIDDRRTGLLVDPNEIDHLVEAVRTLLDNPAEAQRMASDLRESASRFDMDSVIGDLSRDLVASGWR